jgi:hypothetical protein
MGSVGSLAVAFHCGLFGQTNVQVALAGFNEHDLEAVVQVGQAACHDTTA